MSMTSRFGHNDQRMRQRLAMEAARIMADDGVNDYQLAKRKAAVRLGAADTRNLPRNNEIQQALAEYLRLFKADTQPAILKRLRQVAVQAMRLLQPFKPRLVGSVLSGTASQHSNVNLHVFTDTSEEVGLFLMHKRIPCELAEQRLTLMDGNQQNYPAYRFIAQAVPGILDRCSRRDSTSSTVAPGTVLPPMSMRPPGMAEGRATPGAGCRDGHVPRAQATAWMPEVEQRREQLPDALERPCASAVPVEVVVFPVNAIRQAPRSPADGHPMQRAALTAVENLLALDAVI